MSSPEPRPTPAAPLADDVAWINLDVQPGPHCTCRSEAEHLARCVPAASSPPVQPLPPRPARQLPLRLVSIASIPVLGTIDSATGKVSHDAGAFAAAQRALARSRKRGA